MRRIRVATFFAVALALASTAVAEKAPMTPEELLETSTHVVTGTVNAVYERTEIDGDWKYRHRVAEIKVAKCEKGDDIKADGLVYVRYWTRGWVGQGQMPPSTAGHRPSPDAGDQVRVYVAKNAYDGFTRDNNDGGFNVIGRDGFEIIKAADEAGK
jgi:hypothetical protein